MKKNLILLSFGTILVLSFLSLMKYENTQRKICENNHGFYFRMKCLQ